MEISEIGASFAIDAETEIAATDSCLADARRSGKGKAGSRLPSRISKDRHYARPETAIAAPVLDAPITSANLEQNHQELDFGTGF